MNMYNPHTPYSKYNLPIKLWHFVFDALRNNPEGITTEYIKNELGIDKPVKAIFLLREQGCLIASNREQLLSKDKHNFRYTLIGKSLGDEDDSQ